MRETPQISCCPTPSPASPAAGNRIDAPTNLAAPTPGISSVTLSWDAVTGATGYFIDVSELADFSTFINGLQNLAVGATTKALIDLRAGTAQYWRVRATDGVSTSTSASSSFTTAVGTANGPGGSHNALVWLKREDIPASITAAATNQQFTFDAGEPGFEEGDVVYVGKMGLSAWSAWAIDPSHPLTEGVHYSVDGWAGLFHILDYGAFEGDGWTLLFNHQDFVRWPDTITSGKGYAIGDQVGTPTAATKMALLHPPQSLHLPAIVTGRFFVVACMFTYSKTTPESDPQVLLGCASGYPWYGGPIEGTDADSMFDGYFSAADVRNGLAWQTSDAGILGSALLRYPGSITGINYYLQPLSAQQCDRLGNDRDAYYGQMEIYEVAVLEAAPSDADFNLIRSYFNTKFPNSPP